MRKARFLLLLCAVLFSIQARAQDSSRVEVFGGYSFTDYSVYGLYSGPWQLQDFNGWEASATAKFSPHVGVEADFAGGYSPSAHYNLRTYMGGPRFSVGFSRVSLYGHALLGGLTFSGASDYSGSSTSFAAAFGGGADVWFMRHLGVRLIQFDYLLNNNAAAAQTGEGASKHYSNFRIASGVVFRFGH